MAARRLSTTLKAALQLGPRALVHYGVYTLALRSGWLRATTPAGGRPQPSGPIRHWLQPAAAAELRGTARQTLAQADEVLAGKVRLFGGPPQPLRLTPPKPVRHWSHYTRALPSGGDIKPVWEVGRMAWATLLARAYWLSGDEHYAEGFWRRLEQFLRANPANQGPHWSSAQEVALRLLALVYAHRLLHGAAASTPARQARLSQALAQHAERIPPSLSYARAQNNNHLLSEALGMWTAGLALPEHPRAAAWRKLGRATFIDGVARQVAPDGAYSQHSANYQRLMLQLATWAQGLAQAEGHPLPAKTHARLQAACTWLLGLLDEPSGSAANLGPNDGAYILPFSTLPFEDYRPALQASAAALGLPGLPPGPWDDLSLWLGLRPARRSTRRKTAAAPLRLESGDAWGYLRAAQFTGRPGHADQLHFDLWWRGLNLAQDAGTYLYNARAPWDNALTSTALHNTLMLDGREQMTRVGRFLWLDFAQAQVLQHSRRSASAQHNGYRSLGLTHRRSVQAKDAHWLVQDYVLGDTSGHTGRLHWLLPDWPWSIQGDTLQLRSPRGRVRVQVPGQALSLLRAGKRLHGTAAATPTAGWVSRSYAHKQPALALVVELEGAALQSIETRFILPA